MKIESEDLIFLSPIILLVAIVAIGCFCFYQQNNRLMEQCLADGNKEYECYGLMNRGRRR